MAMEREEKMFLRVMVYVLITFAVMAWALWTLVPQSPSSPPSTVVASPSSRAAEETTGPQTKITVPPNSVLMPATENSGATFTAQSYPPLVENGFEVVGPTAKKPADPAPGQRFFDTTLNTYSIYTGASWQAVNVSAGIGNIDDIGDVAAVNPALGEFLGWNGAAWSNLTLSLSTLTDAEVTSASPGQTLRFNGSNFVNVALGVDDLSEIVIGAWEDGEVLRWNGSNLADAKLSLYDLSNVNVASPANGQVLSYNSAQLRWVNSTLSVTTNLDGLSDVTITSAALGDFLGYNGTAWVDTTIALDTLSDVAITSGATGEVLRYNGTAWVDATLDFDDLANVAITGWATGEVPRWNGTALVDATLSIDDLSEVTVTSFAAGEVLRWNGSALVDSKLAMNDLSDVNLTSLADNQFLRWDGGTSKVVNETIDVPADARYFVVTEYGAAGDGVTDDTAEIDAAVDAAVAYAAANSAPAVVFFPALTYIVNDASTDVTGTGESFGGIIIPSTASKIILLGPGATIKIGTNGISTSAVRCFGDNCLIQGLTIDPNGNNAPVARDTAADYATGTLTANGTTTITGSGTTWTKEMVGRTISISGNATIYTITAFTSTTSLTLSGSPTGGAGLTYNIWPFKTKDNSGIELNGCENSAIRDCYVLNGDKTISTYNTGNVSFDFTGGSSERLVTLSGGSWPGWVGVDAAITINGVRYPVVSAPTTTTLTLGANSSSNDENNPGLDVASTANWSVSAYSKASGGENHFLIVNGRRCRIERCLSLDCIYAPFFVSGPTEETVGMATVPLYENANCVIDCTAANFRGNCLRINEGRSVFIRGLIAYSTRNDGRSGILCDAGSSVGDLKTDRIFIDNCELYCNPDGDYDGAASTIKLAASYQVHLRNSKIECGAATNNVALRLEDNLRSVFLEDCYIKPVILFTPASTTGAIFQGDLTGAADNGSGFVRYTVTGTPSYVLVDREMQVRGSAVQQYNGPQTITARGAGFIDTDRPYVSAGIGSGAHGQTGVASFKMRNCTVDGIIPAVVETVSFYNYMIDSCNAFDVDIEGCTFNQFAPLDVQYGCILTDYASENAWSMFRFVRNKVTFDSDKTCRVHRGTTAATEISTSGKTIWYGNEKSNKDSGTVHWCDESNAERLILFTTAGEQSGVYRASAAPTGSTVSWLAGDIVWNDAPTLGEALGWLCVTGGVSDAWQTIQSRTPLMLSNNITEVACTDGTAQDLLTYAMPAGTASRDGDIVEVEASFEFAADADSKQVLVLFGANTLYDSTAKAHNGGSLVVRVRIIRESATLAKCVVTSIATGSGTPITTSSDVLAAVTDFGTSLTIKGRVDATNASDVTQESLIAELTPAVPVP